MESVQAAQSGLTIKGEFNQNGFVNELAHTEGVLSMARAMHPDSAGSQFFLLCTRILRILIGLMQHLVRS